MTTPVTLSEKPKTTKPPISLYRTPLQNNQADKDLCPFDEKTTLEEVPHPNKVVGFTGFVPGAQWAVGMSYHNIERMARMAPERQAQKGVRPAPPPEYMFDEDVPEMRYVQKPLFDKYGRSSNTTTFKLE